MKITPPQDHHHHHHHSPTPSQRHSTATSDSLTATRLRVLSNAHAIYGSTRSLDVITYGAISSAHISAAIVEHNPAGRAFIHCSSAPEASRLAAVEHLLVITEDILARLMDKEGITISGWLPATPATQHAVTFGRQNSFGHQLPLHRHDDMSGGATGSPSGSFPNLNAMSAPGSRRDSVAIMMSGGGGNMIGGGRVEGTVTSSSVSSPVTHASGGGDRGGMPPLLPPSLSTSSSSATVTGGHGGPVGALLHGAGLGSGAHAGGHAGGGAGGGANVGANTGMVAGPRPQRADKVRWIMGSEG